MEVPFCVTAYVPAVRPVTRYCAVPGTAEVKVAPLKVGSLMPIGNTATLGLDPSISIPR